MPGIFGIIRKGAPNSKANEALISAMAARLSHNELYVLEIHHDDWFAVGNIGLPLVNADGAEREERLVHDKERGMVGAFAGYIYGWRDVSPDLAKDTRKKSTRLLDIYSRYRFDLPDKIDGSFNFAIFDMGAQEAFISTDRLGHRHLFYFEDEELFLFSMEAKAFLAYDGFPRELDQSAVADYFNYGYLLGDKTLLAASKLLRGGYRIKVSHGRSCIEKYWDYSYGEPTTQTLPELIEEVDTAYKDIILRRVAGARNVVIPLSGGLDSRFITGHAVQAGIEPYSFSHGRKGCIDHKIATQVAGELGIRNFKFIEIDPSWLLDFTEKFVYLSEGMIESSPAILIGIGNQYGISPLDTAFLNGIFGGPTNFGAAYFNMRDAVSDLSHDEKVNRIANYIGSMPSEGYYNLFTSQVRQSVRDHYRRSIDDELKIHLGVSELFCHQMDVFIIRNRIVRFIDSVDCNRFFWHDHFALADDRLNDFYTKLPPQLRVSRTFLKEYIKAKFPGLAAISYQATGVNLYRTPSAFRTRWRKQVELFKYAGERFSRGYLKFYDKNAYTHYNQWYRTHKPLRRYYEEILLDDMTVRRGYYERAQMEKYLDRQSKGGDSFYTLCYLVTFELFNRIFMDSGGSLIPKINSVRK
jgi:asparagine synthase (glutamine-hydrolysing)